MIEIGKCIRDIVDRNHINHAYLMIYFYDQLVLGKVKDGEVFYALKGEEKPELTTNWPKESDDRCFEIHIFNKEKELRWHRGSGQDEKMTFQCITDPEGERYFGEKMFLLGSRGKRLVKKGEGCTFLSQYGREVVYPFELDGKKENLDLRLVVHHLFSEDGNVCGYRLADMEGGKKSGI